MVLQDIADMPRITRAYFCENMDYIFENMDEDDTAFVICEDDKEKYILCPASWFDITLKNK